MLMGLNLARRASRSGATFRSAIDEARLFEPVCAASGATRKKSTSQGTGRFNLLEMDETTLLMRVSMGSIVANQVLQAVIDSEWHEISLLAALQAHLSETKSHVGTSNRY